ncbi:ribonuclease P protein component [Candidatus Fermentibacterales bacterium]|nr:ribonuclease P protein component [Candidatus Fermentibacterales bacterium]
MYRRGTRLRGSVISVVFARTGSRTVRLGFSVPGRLGGSVLRNRFKRQVREFVRLEQVDGVDLVVSPNGLLEEIACEVLREDLRAMAERIRQELPQGSP